MKQKIKKASKFKFLKHTADIKFQAFGKTLEKAFANSALAMFEAEVDVKKIKPTKKVKIRCEAQNTEELLIEWLNKLLAESSINNMVFSKFKVKIEDNKLTGDAYGEKINQEKQGIKTEVKAATYSELFIIKEKDKYICQVVVDV